MLQQVQVEFRLNSITDWAQFPCETGSKWRKEKYDSKRRTFMASLSLLAKYSCLFSKHSTVKRRQSYSLSAAGQDRRGGVAAVLLPSVRKDFSRSPFTSFLMLSFMSYGL